LVSRIQQLVAVGWSREQKGRGRLISFAFGESWGWWWVSEALMMSGLACVANAWVGTELACFVDGVRAVSRAGLG